MQASRCIESSMPGPCARINDAAPPFPTPSEGIPAEFPIAFDITCPLSHEDSENYSLFVQSLLPLSKRGKLGPLPNLTLSSTSPTLFTRVSQPGVEFFNVTLLGHQDIAIDSLVVCIEFWPVTEWQSAWDSASDALQCSAPGVLPPMEISAYRSLSAMTSYMRRCELGAGGAGSEGESAGVEPIRVLWVRDPRSPCVPRVTLLWFHVVDGRAGPIRRHEACARESHSAHADVPRQSRIPRRQLRSAR